MYTQKELKYVNEGRRRARTDLLWLCNEILDMKSVVEHVHGPIIKTLQQFPIQGEDRLEPNGNFEYIPVNRDPFEVYPDDNKRRLILAPRGWYKTSINVVGHSIQFLLNFPDATILIVHASQVIAEQILFAIKNVFRKNTVMRYLFPEFCPPMNIKEWGTSEYFNSPARRIMTISPTIQVSGIETVRTGMHYHVIKFTDIVDEKNSATKDQCLKVIFRYGMCRNLLMSPNYWMDLEGTRYHFSDLYGRIIDENKKTNIYKIFVMGCYKKDTENKQENFTPEELDFPYLLDANGNKISRFPEKFPLESLEEIRKDPVTGEYMFACQQLNNPVETEDEEQPFSIKHLRWKSQEDISRIPMQYYMTTVDLAETTNKRSNFTAITTCGIDRMNRRYVIDIRLKKMMPDEIVGTIFDIQKLYRPRSIKIEESSFMRGLMPTVHRMSEITNVWPNFVFLKRDSQISKTERIMSLQPWYKSGLLVFSEGLADFVKEHLKHELTRFPKYAFDDILDTLADQFQNEVVFGPVKESPSMQQLLQNANRIMFENWDKYEQIFGKTERSDDSWSGLGV